MQKEGNGLALLCQSVNFKNEEYNTHTHRKKVNQSNKPAGTL